MQKDGRLEDFTDSRVQIIDQNQLLALEVDVLVLAALGDVITKDNHHLVKASYILELANAPLDQTALVKTTARGIQVIPSLLASSGGVIVSYLEYCQNIIGACWSLKQVNQRMASIIRTAGRHIYNFAQDNQLALYQAAFAYGLAQFFVDTQNFQPPLKNSTAILSDYGWQVHPQTEVKTKNNGLNLKAELDDPVFSIGYGKVVEIKNQGLLGEMLIIEHRLGIQSAYANLREIKVAEGDLVKTNQLIAKVASSKSRSDISLYFAILEHYRWVDPKPFLNRWGLILGQDDYFLKT